MLPLTTSVVNIGQYKWRYLPVTGWSKKQRGDGTDDGTLLVACVHVTYCLYGTLLDKTDDGTLGLCPIVERGVNAKSPLIIK